jgi:ribosomal-protein-alanine acetyltransferase
MRRLAELRPMGPADVPVVAALEALIYSYPWSAGNFSDSLAAGYSCTVAEVGGGVVGYGVLMMGVEEAQLLNISVAPALRRQGIASVLWEHFLEQGRALGALHLGLEVRESNAAALAFYERHGCVVVGRRRGYYPAASGREDALLVSLPLSAVARLSVA